MKLDAEGWVDAAAVVASSNCDTRPPGVSVELVVIHAISLPPGKYGRSYISDLFQNRLAADAHPYFQDIHQLRVSAHFLIDRDGCLSQFVSCNRRAWHAGASNWEGRERCNDFSLGIELEGCDNDAFEPIQYRQLNSLLAVLAEHYPIRAVLGHSDIAPGRKTDPGPYFDWRQVEWGGGARN